MCDALSHDSLLYLSHSLKQLALKHSPSKRRIPFKSKPPSQSESTSSELARQEAAGQANANASNNKASTSGSGAGSNSRDSAASASASAAAKEHPATSSRIVFITSL